MNIEGRWRQREEGPEVPRDCFRSQQEMNEWIVQPRLAGQGSVTQK